MPHVLYLSDALAGDDPLTGLQTAQTGSPPAQLYLQRLRMAGRKQWDTKGLNGLTLFVIIRNIVEAV